jgi:hypothetical protein
MKDVRRNGDRVERRDKKRSNFVWEPRKQSDMEKHASRRTTRYDSLFKEEYREWRAKGGSNTIRILPATWKNHKHYGWEFWAHTFVGADKGSYPCLRKMLDKRCPVCEAHKMAVKDGDEDQIRQLSPKNMFAYWIIDREADKAYQDKPQILAISGIRDKEIMGLTQDRKKRSFIYIEHPEEGYDLSFNREGQGLGTKYISYQFDRDPSPISQDADTQAEILDFIALNPIPECLQYYDAEYLDGVMFGTAGNDRDPDLDSDAPGDEEDDEERTDEADEHEGSEQDEERGEEEEDEERDNEEEEEAPDEEEPEEEPEAEPEVTTRRRVPEREPARAGSNGKPRERERLGPGHARPHDTTRPHGTTVARRPAGKDRPEKTYRK